MKHSVLTFAAALALGTVTLTSAAQAVDVKFTGTFLLKSKSAGCSSVVTVGSQSLMIYWPAGLGTNGSDTSILLRDWFEFGNVQHYGLASGSLVGSAYKTVAVTTIIGTRGGIGNRGSGLMRILSQAPAAPTAATPTITLSGNIANWYSDADCNVGFSAVLTRTPNLP